MRAVVLGALATLCLSGCAVVGTVDVRSPDEVAIDLVVTGDESYLPLCEPTGWPADAKLSFVEQLNEVGERVCRVSGVTHPEIIREYLGLTHVGEYFVVEANPLSLAPRSPVPIGSIWSAPDTRLDVAINFPGRVLSTTGVADGSTVRFSDPTQFLRAYGLRATALDHPGPEWTMLGPVIGLLAGLGLAVLGWYVRRQRRRPDPDANLASASQAPADNLDPSAAGTLSDGPPPEPPPAMDEPPRAEPGGSSPQPGAPDAEPPAEPGGSNPQPGAPHAQPPAEPDHGRWAPPRE